MKKLYYVICGKNKKFEKPKKSYLLEETLVLSVICKSVRMKMKIYLKKKNQLRY